MHAPTVFVHMLHTSQGCCPETGVLTCMQSQVIKYGKLSVHIKEGALGDGLGARVWVVAHTLCR